MSDPFALLASTAARWGVPLSDTQQAQFVAYAAELQRWNAHTNLTAVRDVDGMVRRLFLDALLCARHWGAEPPATLADIGSGAGFPGLPLKLAVPTLHLTLIESVQKKAAFLSHIAAHLGLEHVTVLARRAEDVGHERAHRAGYDVVTVRAVAALPVLAEYGLPLLRVGGLMLAPKGRQSAEEVAGAQRALDTLGGHVQEVVPVVLPDEPPRTLVVIKKIRATPARYPRAVGVPAQRPL